MLIISLTRFRSLLVRLSLLLFLSDKFFLPETATFGKDRDIMPKG